MNIISSSDTIFATVINCGNTIYRTTIAGATSLAQVVNAVRAAISGMAGGMVTLIVRNGSRGWQLRSLIDAAPRPEAIQLTLF